VNLQFQKKEVPCLKSPLSQVQNLEQAQELRIPEGMPGAARILAGWGQVLLRSKEWNRDTIHVSGGVLVWVLYEPEDGSQPRRLETWIPFQMNWDLPEDSPEGRVRIRPLLRYVDARTVSSGKVMIRVGIGLLAQCWHPHRGEVYQMEDKAGEVELLHTRWPVRLPREAGEKPFEMEETLSLPASAPAVDQVIYFRMDPAISDRKVLGNRMVFRGNGNLHLLYRSEDGQLHNWEFELPFSQYTDLEDTYSPDAQADVMMAVTRLELEPDGEGKLNLRAGLTGQYLVDDREMLDLVEDAYLPGREVSLNREELELPVLLDSRRENIYGEQTVPAGAQIVADTVFLPDFPRQRREGDRVVLELPATAQILYYDDAGRLQSAQQRWEGTASIPADEGTSLTAMPQYAQAQVIPGTDSIQLRSDVPVQLIAAGGQGMPMVTRVEAGEKKEPDPNRPSLVLRRANGRLWDLARASGSTMAAIREANGLTGEPEPGKMLLIPVM